MHYYHGKGKLYRSTDEGWQEYSPGKGWVVSFHAEAQVTDYPDDYEELVPREAIELAQQLEDN